MLKHVFNLHTLVKSIYIPNWPELIFFEIFDIFYHIFYFYRCFSLYGNFNEPAILYCKTTDACGIYKPDLTFRIIFKTQSGVR